MIRLKMQVKLSVLDIGNSFNGTGKKYCWDSLSGTSISFGSSTANFLPV